MDNLFTPMNPDEELDPITGLPILKTEPAMQSQGSVQDLLKSLNAVQPTPDSVEPKIDARDYLMRKYNLGNYDDNARQELQKQTDLNGGDYLSAGLMGLGAAFQGKDSGSAISSNLNQRQSQKNQKLDQFEKGRLAKIQEIGLDRDLAKYEREDRDDAEKQAKIMRERDPSSEESKMAQDLAKAMGYKADVSALTAEQFQAFSPALQKRYEIAQRSLDRQESASERASARAEAKESRDFQRELARSDKKAQEAKPSEKQVKEFTDFDNALDSIKSIRSQKGQFDTGPLAGRMNSVAGLVGLDDADKTAFRSQVQDQLAQYIKSISGGAVSDQERASLIQNIPTMNDNDETFQRKLDVLEQRLERNRKNALENANKMGKDVKSFERPSSTSDIKVIGGKTYRKVSGGWEEI